jgi:diguanylate cyclase (GGDEF)-like protein/PAS domain S-box-containing protein
MTDTQNLTEMLEAALDTLDEGIAVLDDESRVLFWNNAAAAITGYHRADMIARIVPPDLYQVNTLTHNGDVRAISGAARPTPVHLRHHLGHTLPATLRRTTLRNTLGARSGLLLRFHPVEEIDALPHGEASENGLFEHSLERTHADLEERLDEAHREWIRNATPFGVLWITVDQAAMLRKTHGRDASEAMLGIVERTLLNGLRPAETLGRWGDNEFLALSHEQSAEMLMTHGQHLAGVALTADFRWWGDRVNLTVSIGAAQASEDESLSTLLKLAQQAMQSSVSAGGNHVSGVGGQACSQS